MSEQHVFPWWAGYFLLNPVRKASLNPEIIMKSYIKPGMKIIDAGCAMGFFSLPLARITGKNGKVISIDPQKKMLSRLKKRAAKAELSDIIDTRLCTFDSLMINDLHSQVDIALAFGVLHEVKDNERFTKELASALKKGGIFFLGEPHVVSMEEFKTTVNKTMNTGFDLDRIIVRGKNKIAVLRKI